MSLVFFLLDFTRKVGAAGNVTNHSVVRKYLLQCFELETVIIVKTDQVVNVFQVTIHSY